MLTVYSPDHGAHHGREVHRGRLIPAFDAPRRAQAILDRIRDIKLGPVAGPWEFGDAPILRVHNPEYLDFLHSASDSKSLRQNGADHEHLIPNAPWPTDAVARCPTSLLGRLNFFAADACVSIAGGTWRAARAASQVALTAADRIFYGERSAFALCRPPGHHAGPGRMAGYCFLNNAAVAAQHLTDRGLRVAILDVDYHHGNGTQAIFYDRPDALFVSLHADPAWAYPYSAGYADELGVGDGEGFNANYPLPTGTNWGDYSEALGAALARIANFGPDAVVVSLGVDTYEGDPLGEFRLRLSDYLHLGRSIARERRHTLFVLEGGYATSDEELSLAVVNVLTGFEDGN